jgi:hypothetical protein
MPAPDQLHRERSADGLVVLGFCVEDPKLQRQFTEKFPVSYPLLANEGNIPETFGTAARYPSNFLIDRQGQLRRARMGLSSTWSVLSTGCYVQIGPVGMREEKEGGLQPVLRSRGNVTERSRNHLKDGDLVAELKTLFQTDNGKQFTPRTLDNLAEL